MLLGQYEGKLGAKGRTNFPKKFQRILGNRLIVTKGYEKSLIVVSIENWETLLEGTSNRPFTESATRDTQRFLLGGAFDIELDDKGRFILPASLMEFASIDEDITYLGLSKFVEVWSTSVWKEYSLNLENTIEAIAHRLNVVANWERSKK